jgi:hypothetical protein
VLKFLNPSPGAQFPFILISNFTAKESRICIKITEKSAANAISHINRQWRTEGGAGGGGRPGRRREGGAKMGIKAQGPGNDFFNRPTRAGWDHCQCHEVHVSQKNTRVHSM